MADYQEELETMQTTLQKKEKLKVESERMLADATQDMIYIYIYIYIHIHNESLSIYIYICRSTPTPRRRSRRTPTSLSLSLSLSLYIYIYIYIYIYVYICVYIYIYIYVSLKADTDFFDTTKAACVSKTEAWSERKSHRTQEMEGIEKALTILTSDEAKDLFSKSIKPGYDKAASFLQVHAASRASPLDRASQALQEHIISYYIIYIYIYICKYIYIYIYT